MTKASQSVAFFDWSDPWKPEWRVTYERSAIDLQTSFFEVSKLGSPNLTIGATYLCQNFD